MKNTNYLTRLRNAGLITTLIAGSATTTLLHADVFSDAIENGKTSLNMRLRYESVDVNSDNVISSTSLRTRLGLTSADVNGFKAMVEFENVSVLDEEDGHPFDPPATEINQFWLNYKADGFSGKLGNQIYTLDDHRFIGHVGWRQNIQTFNGLTGQFNVGDAVIKAAYIDEVNRIDATDEDLDGILLHGTYSVSDALNLTAFGYLLEFDDKAAWSSDTLGVRATGKIENFTYAASIAKQGDNGGSPDADFSSDFSADYLALEVNGKFDPVTVGVGYEVLGADNGRSFSTPLATVHKFNGFADVFAVNSIGGNMGKGLEDIYFKVAAKAGPVPITVFYHMFSTDDDGIDLGTELDVTAAYKLNDYTKLVAKTAFYDSDKSGEGYGNADKSVFTIEANVIF